MSGYKPCPFCKDGGKVEVDNPMLGYISGYGFHCIKCDAYFQLGDSEEEAIEAWNTRYERTCHKIPGRMKYGTRVPKCSECGQSLGDKRWNYCPNCGARVINE